MSSLQTLGPCVFGPLLPDPLCGSVTRRPERKPEGPRQVSPGTSGGCWRGPERPILLRRPTACSFLPVGRPSRVECVTRKADVETVSEAGVNVGDRV